MKELQRNGVNHFSEQSEKIIKEFYKKSFQKPLGEFAFQNDSMLDSIYGDPDTRQRFTSFHLKICSNCSAGEDANLSFTRIPHPSFICERC